MFKAVFITKYILALSKISLDFKTFIHQMIIDPPIPTNLIAIKSLMAFHVILWSIHTTTLEERNNSRTLTLKELYDRILHTLSTFLYAYHYSYEWPTSLAPYLRSISEELAEFPQDDRRVCLRFALYSVPPMPPP